MTTDVVQFDVALMRPKNKPTVERITESKNIVASATDLKWKYTLTSELELYPNYFAVLLTIPKANVVYESYGAVRFPPISMKAASSTPLTINFKGYTLPGDTYKTAGKASTRYYDSITTDYKPDRFWASFKKDITGQKYLPIGTEIVFDIEAGLKNPMNTKPVEQWKIEIFISEGSNCDVKTINPFTGTNLEKCRRVEVSRDLIVGDGYSATMPFRSKAGSDFLITRGLNIQKKDPAKYWF